MITWVQANKFSRFLRQLACFLFLSVCLPVSGYGQGFQGDEITNIPGKPGMYRLKGNVKIVHGGNRIYSDFADYDQKTGSCQAYQNLRIYTNDNVFITGEVLDYNGSTGSYVVDRNVVLKDGEMTMKTPSLLFEGKTNTAYYDKGGEMISGETVLTSERGYYEGKKELFHCFGNVIIVNPEYTIWTDTLHYRKTGMTHFAGETQIETTDYYMFGRKGWFNQKEEKVSLQYDAYVKSKTTQVLFGDSIYYDLALENGNAHWNVLFLDTARHCYVKSEYAENDEKEGRAFFTVNPRGVLVEQGDSLFIVSDTMVVTYDTARQLKGVFAYHGVRFFRETIQGKCDSLSYMQRDSLMIMHREPMVWIQDYQIDGDTIKTWFKEERPDKVLVQNNTFIVSEVSAGQGYYNQVKGRRLWGYFNDSSEFRLAHVIGMAQSIYYVIDEEKWELLGVNKTESESLKMYFEKNQVYGINAVKPTSSILYPVDKLTARQRVLRGFHWFPQYRPLSQYDLFPSW